MIVLHIISSGGMYGAEAVILNLSRTLNAARHRSILGVFANHPEPNLQLHQAARREGIESHTIPSRGLFDRSVPAAIRALVQQTGADIVHAHGYKADVYVYLALRKSQIPIVSTCHTWYDNDTALRLYGAIDRWVLRSFAGVVAVSEEVRQRLFKSSVRKENVRLIPNGIDLRPFDIPKTHPDLPALRVGLVGRLSQEKGVDLFLQAAALVLAELPQTRFVVMGEGPQRPELEALIQQLDIEHSASLPGRTDQMPAFYATLDVLVSASRQEGLPIALLEGMASCLPLVATAVGEVPSLVQDGRTGLLVPPEDVPSLAQAILTLLQDPTLRQRLGEAARALVADEFSADRMTADYLSLYQQVIAATGKDVQP
jgi:glycosyltransferase involved in cell wall biosynthesis